MSAGLRVGDRERELTIDRLSAHAAAGRLTVDELEERVARAHRAVTEADLERLESDLPAPLRRPGPFARRSYPVIVAAALAAFVAPLLVLGHPVVPPFFVLALWFFVVRPRALGRASGGRQLPH